jgi:hypothetical protein
MLAKNLIIEKWVNTEEDFHLDVRGNYIKIIHAFQMLCPGCVYRGIPQTIELYQKFNSEEVKVVGLHSVFENHEAMQPHALDVFISEWRLPFPIAIDKKLEGEWMPETMKSFHLQGTPSLIIIDHLGQLKLCHFGHLNQENLEKFITDLLNQKGAA